MIATRLRTSLCVAATLVAGAPAALAQDADAGLWLELALGEKIDRVGFDFHQHLRFDRDVSRVSAIMPQANVSLEVAEFLTSELGYRYEYERNLNDDEFSTGHRLHAQLGLEGRAGRLEPNLRLRAQERVQDGLQAPTLRERLELKWRTGQWWRPAISAELFHMSELSSETFKKVRLAFGAEAEQFDQKLELQYLIELEDVDSTKRHIVALELDADWF